MPTPEETTSAAWEAYIRAVRDNLNASFARASNARATLKRTRERLGLPFMIEQSGEGQIPAGAWNEGLDQDLLRAGSMVATLTRFADEAVAGKRKFGYDQDDELAFERLDGDFSRVEMRGGQPIEIENATNAPVRVTGTLGVLPPIVLGIIIVAAIVTTYFAVEQVCETIEHTAESKQIETVSTNGADLIKSGKATPEQVKALTESIYEGAAQVHTARALEKTEGKSEIPQTIRTVGYIALGLGALYVVWQLISRSGGGRAMVPARMLGNPFTLVLRDSFGDVHAAREQEAAAPENIERAAQDFADRLGFEPGEKFRVGLGQARDPGAARLRGDEPFEEGGTEWLYYLTVPRARMQENPTRRSGDVKVKINYRDAEDDYAGVVTWPGGSWRFEELRASPHWQSTHAVDSAETYDEVSRAALSFGADENEDIYAHADTDERGDFVVRRR